MGTFNCPVCLAPSVACRCGADLTLLRQLDSIADVWFNRALETLGAGAPGRALEWLSACCAAQPTDSAARRAQAKVWAQLGRWQEATDALERAASIEPDAPELQAIRQAIQDGTTHKKASRPAATHRPNSKGRSTLGRGKPGAIRHKPKQEG